MTLPTSNRNTEHPPLPPLRRRQSKCLQKALSTQHPHFLYQATPGAGKIRLAAELAKALVSRGEIDYVLYCGPTRAVVQAAVEGLQTVLEQPMHGQLGTVGTSLTYHALPDRLDNLQRLGKRHRMLLTWDESHHAAGHHGGDGPNKWGMAILALERQMTYTLALSGTPWRTDGSCLPLLRYVEVTDTSHTKGASNSTPAPLTTTPPEASHILQPNYVYTLQDAIRDGVCRYPRVQLTDNHAIRLTRLHPRSGRQENHHNAGIPQLLRHPAIDYSSLVRLDAPMQPLLDLRGQQLSTLASSGIAPDIAVSSAFFERPITLRLTV